MEANIESPAPGGNKIFLIGIMGSGKTYWAQRIAAQLNLDWIDLDQQIEKATGMPVREVFATEGEAYFRMKERDTLRQLATTGNIVIATGGGTPCYHNNMEWMNENGTTIWLNVDPEVLATRLMRGRHRRPLISHLADDEIYGYIVEKLQERTPYYALARYQLAGKQYTLDQFLQILYHAH